MSFVSRTVDTFYAFRFLRLFTTPWEKTGAFKAGIIDKDGKVLRKVANNDKDKSVYNIFHKLVFNLKRLLNKLPLGKYTLSSYIAALYLIKESDENVTDETLVEIMEGISPDWKMQIDESELLQELPDKAVWKLSTDIPLLEFDTVACAGSTIYIDDNWPVDHILGIPVFEGIHAATAQTIRVTQFNLK